MANRSHWPALHRWLAWMLGGLFALQGLSGTLLALSGPLEGWLVPDLAVPAAERIALVDAAVALESRHPNSLGFGVAQPDDAGRLVTAFWPTADPLLPSERLYWLARLHPGSGEALDVRRYGDWSMSRLGWLVSVHALHTNLTLGALGKYLLFACSGGLLLLLAAGLLTWQARRRALAGKPAHAIHDPAPGRWHRRLGLSVGGFLAILVASGAALQFETVLDPGFSLRSEQSGDRQAIGMRRAWEAAIAGHPEAETRLVMAPFLSGGVYRIDLERAAQDGGGTVEVFVDAYSAKVLRERSTDTSGTVEYLIGLLGPLHGGAIAGDIGVALAGLLGLVPVCMLASALSLRLVRRRNRRQA